jgi:hypothetical protein
MKNGKGKEICEQYSMLSLTELMSEEGVYKTEITYSVPLPSIRRGLKENLILNVYSVPGSK